MANALADRQLRQLVVGPKPAITLTVRPGIIQPASIDLPTKGRIWMVAGKPATAGGFDLRKYVKDYAYPPYYTVPKGELFTVARNQTYLFELEPTFRLPSAIEGTISPKSSAGRVEVQCVVVAEGGRHFNTVEGGYEGRLAMFVSSPSFPLYVPIGAPLVQLRLTNGPPVFLQQYELEVLHQRFDIIRGTKRPNFAYDGLVMSLDLRQKPACLVTKKRGLPLPLDADGSLKPKRYFAVKDLDHAGRLIIDPGEFALVSTIERIRIPRKYCAEMVTYVEGLGQYSSHCAGFFDPGFGYGKNGEVDGASAVLEIRNLSDQPLIFSHGQAVCLFRFQELQTKAKPYGSKKGRSESHYQGQQRIRLAKYFKPWPKK